MRSFHKSIHALACVSFLAITLSGFHLHADICSHEESGSHKHELHQVVSHDSVHDTDHFDISVFDPATGFSKIEACPPTITIPMQLAEVLVDTRWSKDAPDIIPRRSFRSRPALRAPPNKA